MILIFGESVPMFRFRIMADSPPREGDDEQ